MAETATGTPAAIAGVAMGADALADPCRIAAQHAMERAQQAAEPGDPSNMRASLEEAIEVIDPALATPVAPVPEMLCAVADDLEAALDSLEAGGSPDLQPVIEKAEAIIQP